MKYHRRLLAASGLIAALALASCGGDDDDEHVPPTVVTEVPASAGLDTASFLAFIQGLSGSDETSEPLTISDSFAVPADETAEPTPLP